MPTASQANTTNSPGTITRDRRRQIATSTIAVAVLAALAVLVATNVDRALGRMSGTTSNDGGWTPVVITSGSMEPTVGTGDVLLVPTTAVGDLDRY